MSWRLTTLNHAIAPGPVEARGLVQALFDTDNTTDAARLQIWAGTASLHLADLVAISETSGTHDTIVFEGDFSRWNGLGFGLSQGKMIVHGDTGARTGGELSGGSIEIHGHCGPWAAVSARSGRMTIHGNAGDWLAANWPGETKGLSGAEIIVQGHAGDHAGSRMRRGLIAIGGDTGIGLGRSMVAGSIFVGGMVKGPVGLGMKRGSIVFQGPPNHPQLLSPSFKTGGEFRPLTLNMQLKYLHEIGWQKAPNLLSLKSCERYSGDLLALGLGEVLALA